MNNVKNDKTLSELKELLDFHDLKILKPILNKIQKVNIVDIQNDYLKGVTQTYVVYQESGFRQKEYHSYLITYFPDKIEKRLLCIYHILNGHKPGILPDTFVTNKKPKLVNLMYSYELGKVELDLIKVPEKSIHPELHLKKLSDWLKFQISQIYLKNPFEGIIGFYKNIELILPTHCLFENTESINDIVKLNMEDSRGINKKIDSLSKFHVSIFQNKIFATHNFSFYQGDNPRDGNITIELTISDLYNTINKESIYLN